MAIVRVLVTGWRFWPQEAAWYIHRQLDLVHQTQIAPVDQMLVIDGECPRGGVDQWAHEWAVANLGMEFSERHPAPWRQMGNAAGPQRNQHMVNLGAAMCLAFPGPVMPGRKSGTYDCVDRAKAAGIVVHEFPWKDIFVG